MLVISGIAAAVIGGLAISTHLRLSALEPESHGNESAEEVAQEILTGQPAHTEEGEESEAANNTESSHSEGEESPEERAAEGG
ncbi:MAG TPA: hypothetical protein VNB95_00320 [Nitrososphaera sp.]|nr:hypothetical protein [Nitrososphaera sp.]